MIKISNVKFAIKNYNQLKYFSQSIFQPNVNCTNHLCITQKECNKLNFCKYEQNKDSLNEELTIVNTNNTNNVSNQLNTENSNQLTNSNMYNSLSDISGSMSDLDY